MFLQFRVRIMIMQPTSIQITPPQKKKKRKNTNKPANKPKNITKDQELFSFLFSIVLFSIAVDFIREN